MPSPAGADTQTQGYRQPQRHQDGDDNAVVIRAHDLQQIYPSIHPARYYGHRQGR